MLSIIFGQKILLNLIKGSSTIKRRRYYTKVILPGSRKGERLYRYFYSPKEYHAYLKGKEGQIKANGTGIKDNRDVRVGRNEDERKVTSKQISSKREEEIHREDDNMIPKGHTLSVNKIKAMKDVTLIAQSGDKQLWTMEPKKNVLAFYEVKGKDVKLIDVKNVKENRVEIIVAVKKRFTGTTMIKNILFGVPIFLKAQTTLWGQEEIKRPGSRGGKWWMDESGHIRYGPRPGEKLGIIKPKERPQITIEGKEESGKIKKMTEKEITKKERLKFEKREREFIKEKIKENKIPKGAAKLVKKKIDKIIRKKEEAGQVSLIEEKASQKGLFEEKIATQKAKKEEREQKEKEKVGAVLSKENLKLLSDIESLKISHKKMVEMFDKDTLPKELEPLVNFIYTPKGYGGYVLNEKGRAVLAYKGNIWEAEDALEKRGGADKYEMTDEEWDRFYEKLEAKVEKENEFRRTSLKEKQVEKKKAKDYFDELIEIENARRILRKRGLPYLTVMKYSAGAINLLNSTPFEIIKKLSKDAHDRALTILSNPELEWQLETKNNMKAYRIQAELFRAGIIRLAPSKGGGVVVVPTEKAKTLTRNDFKKKG